ncbi:MAG: hypothetical protein Q8S84_04315 [bacterium]|nr:hypothetical protein [bacterium]MDP3380729.1 hypothetical protein [bacterium]
MSHSQIISLASIFHKYSLYSNKKLYFGSSYNDFSLTTFSIHNLFLISHIAFSKTLVSTFSINLANFHHLTLKKLLLIF